MGLERALACIALLLTLSATAADPAPPTLPVPPYFSIELGMAETRAEALEMLQPYANELRVRAEQRGSGWPLRVGAWSTRRDAELALEAFQARGARDARILDMRTPAPWLLPDGRLLRPAPKAPPTAAAPAAAAPEGTVAVPTPTPPPSRRANVEVSKRYREQAQKYDVETRRQLRMAGAARRDGFLYGMDVAPLLAYAAERGDAGLYKDLLPYAQKLVLRADSGTFTEGFVLWRHKAGMKPEVSGATEAAWMARALWTGAEAFKRPEDRALALKILDGYARHAFEQNNVWFVRKYYAFGANAFANLSVLGNYQPDFLADAERAAGATSWRGMAERSYALLERAVSPSRLLYPLVVPEIGATWPGQNVDVFAPNGLVTLADSCDAAEAALRGRPKLAQGVLKFVGARYRNAFGRLHAYYDANEGDPRGEQSLSTTGYACLGRLAALLGSDGAWERLEPQLLNDMTTLPTMALSNDAPLYSAGPLLLTAWAAGAL